MQQKTVDFVLPEVNENATSGSLLLNFYKSLGWDTIKQLDPKKIFISHSSYEKLHQLLLSVGQEDREAISFLMINYAPSVKEDISDTSVVLLNGAIYD